jgi:hypothetical protein
VRRDDGARQQRQAAHLRRHAARDGGHGHLDQTLLAELTLNATAFAGAVAGVATANAITSDSSADNTGTATWFRVVESNGTTILWDGSVGTSGADLNLNTVGLVAGAAVAVSSFTVTETK